MQMSCSLDKQTIENQLLKAIKAEARFPEDTNIHKVSDDLAKSINSKYRYEVLTNMGGLYSVSIPEGLVMEYIIGQRDSGPIFMDYLIQKYKGKISENSLNLLSEHLWMDHPILQNSSVQTLMKFMKKINPNAIVTEVENLDQNAVSLISDHIVLLKNGALLDELPEEVAHFYVELAPKELQDKMIKEVMNHKIYGETYEKYKNNPVYQKDGKPNIQKIQKEAVAKLIAKTVKDIWDNPKTQSKFRTLIEQLIRFIKKSLATLFPTYREPLFSTSEIEKAAGNIINVDITELNLSKVPTIYDSVFFSAVEEAKPVFVESELTKSLITFSKGLNRTLSYIFRKNIKSSSLQGLKEALEDNPDSSYNKFFNIKRLVQDAAKDIKAIEEIEGMNRVRELDIMLNTVEKLTLAYNEMSIIPKAMDKALEKMKSDGTISSMVDNISEIHAYMTFSKQFKNIISEFTKLLVDINTYNGNEFTKEELNWIYEKMKDKMETSSLEFETFDRKLMNLIKHHLTDLVNAWADKYFDKWKSLWQTKIDNPKIKDDKVLLSEFKKMLIEQITTPQDIKNIVDGTLSKVEETLPNGKKVYNKKVLDVDKGDITTFLFSSPTLIKDPFVSSFVHFYLSQVLEAKNKGQRQAKEFLGPLLDMKEKFQGEKDWYEFDRMFQNVQTILSEDGSSTQKRFLISEFRAYDAMSDLKQTKRDLKKAERDLASLEATDTPERREAKKKVDELRDLVKSKQSKFYGRFTPEYYAIVGTHKDDINKPLFKKAKDLFSEIQRMHNKVIELSITSNLWDKSALIETEAKLRDLQVQYAEQLKLLPKLDRERMQLISSLYEVNTDKSRVELEAHRQNFLISTTAMLMENSGLTKEAAEAVALKSYETLYIKVVPTQEYFDKMKSLYEKLGNLQGGSPKIKSILQKMSDVRLKIYEILKPYRVDGSVTISSLKEINGIETTVLDDVRRLELEYKGLLLSLKSFQVLELLAGGSGAHLKKASIMHGLATVTASGLEKDIIEQFSEFGDLTPSDIKFIQQMVAKSELDEQPYIEVLNRLLEIAKDKIKQKGSRTKEEEEEDSNIIEAIQWGIGRRFTFATLLHEIDNALAVPIDNKDIRDVFDEINSISEKRLTNDYFLFLKDYVMKLQEMLFDSDFNHPRKEDILNDLADIIARNTKINIKENISIPALHLLAFSGNFQNIKKILKKDTVNTLFTYLSTQRGTSDDPGYQNYMDFFLKLHELKLDYISDIDPSDQDETARPSELRIEEMIFHPMKLALESAPINNPYSEGPRYGIEMNVRANRHRQIKEFYENEKGEKIRLLTEKINYLDPRVLAGTAKPTVDMNGNWLPNEMSDFRDEKYAALMASGNKQLIDYYNTLKNSYLKYQVDNMMGGDSYFDLGIPTKRDDKYESKMDLIKDTKNRLSTILKNIPFVGSKDNESVKEELEELGALTVREKDMFGDVISREDSVKLRSRRELEISKTSEDILSSIALFIEELEDYKAKNYIAPVFQSMTDVFDSNLLNNPRFNVDRAKIMKQFKDFLIFNKVPEGFLNNKNVVAFLNVVSSLTSARLLLDPLGAMINLTSGELQSIIQNAFIPKEWANYFKVMPDVGKWLYAYNKDFYSKTNITKETQLIAQFGILPDARDMSQVLSRRAQFSSVRERFMAPRTLTEEEMGIHIGLTILRANSLEINGKSVNIEDLYELDQNTGLTKLKDEYSNLSKQWNPLDGTEVNRIRNIIVQRYITIQGNFYKQTPAYISSNALGRAAQIMKRWFTSNSIRRYGDWRWDPFLEENWTGYHRSMLTLLGSVFRSLGTLSTDPVTNRWSTMTPHERGNIGRSFAEPLYIAVFATLAMLMGYEGDDKNKKVKEMTYMQRLALLIINRVQGELGTFIPLPVFGLGYMEIKRVALDPFGIITSSGINNIAALGSLLVQHLFYAMGADSLEKNLFYSKDQGYDSWAAEFLGYRQKGSPKIWSIALNTIGINLYTTDPGPYIKTMDNLQNRVK